MRTYAVSSLPSLCQLLLLIEQTTKYHNQGRGRQDENEEFIDKGVRTDGSCSPQRTSHPTWRWLETVCCPSAKLECGWKLVGWSLCPLKHPHVTPRRQRERHASVRPWSSEPWCSHLAPRTDSPRWSTDMICLLPLSPKRANFLMFGAYIFFSLGKSWEHPGNNKCVNYKGHLKKEPHCSTRYTFPKSFRRKII